MLDTNKLDELIALLERAPHGDRELDCRIFEAIGGCEGEWSGSEITSFARSPGGDYTFNTADGYRHLQATYASHYTTRLGDAVAIVPKDCWYLFSAWKTRPDEPLYGASVVRGNIEESTKGPALGIAEHETSLPLAICIAALKARRALA